MTSTTNPRTLSTNPHSIPVIVWSEILDVLAETSDGIHPVATDAIAVKATARIQRICKRHEMALRDYLDTDYHGDLGVSNGTVRIVLDCEPNARRVKVPGQRALGWHWVPSEQEAERRRAERAAVCERVKIVNIGGEAVVTVDGFGVVRFEIGDVLTRNDRQPNPIVSVASEIAEQVATAIKRVLVIEEGA